MSCILSVNHILIFYYYFNDPGWLLEPESRPDFEELGHRFQEFMDDPPRYVLTVVSVC